MHDAPNWLCELIPGLSGHTYYRVRIVKKLGGQRGIVSKLDVIHGVVEGFFIRSRGCRLSLEAQKTVPLSPIHVEFNCIYSHRRYMFCRIGGVLLTLLCVAWLQNELFANQDKLIIVGR